MVLVYLFVFGVGDSELVVRGVNMHASEMDEVFGANLCVSE